MLHGREFFFRDLSGAYIQDVIYVTLNHLSYKYAALLSIHSESNFYHIGIDAGQQIRYSQHYSANSKCNVP